MAEFLELVEQLRAEEASLAKLYAGDGRSARALRQAQNYTQRLAEATQLVADICEGKRPMNAFAEAMGTTDFPYLFGDVLDRQILAAYQEWKTTWQNYIRKATVRDFRPVERYYLDGGEAFLESVDENTEYPAAALTDGQYTYQVRKYGRRLPFSWEAMINDDLDAFRSIPERLGRAARRSEERFATSLFVDANGPHASVYTGGNANIVTGDPKLSITALQTAMEVLGAMVDADGEPIVIETVHLVVPPALEVTAKNILNATAITVDPNVAAGTAQQVLTAQNWMRNAVQLHVNPYIPVIASSANGSTSWWLFADPRVGRPAAELGFLRGHETPEIFVKAPNAARIGGGTNPMDGDFDTDSIQYKVRHVFGGAIMSPKATVGSKGTA